MLFVGQNEDAGILKEPEMLKRLKTINAFSEQEKQQVYFTPDAVIHEVKSRKVYAK